MLLFRINGIDCHILGHTVKPALKGTSIKQSYLDLHLEIDSEYRLGTKLYDKRDYFNASIVNFPFICSNIPAATAYGAYISQLIR
jgi:hypothetical protein